MSPTADETPEEAAFRARVRAALAGRPGLTVRAGTRPVGLLGAGGEDLVAGRAFLAALADGGLAVPTWPVERGGMGATPAQVGIVAAELARYDAPDLYPFLVGTALVGPVLMAHATVEQQERWLDPIRVGGEIWCQLFSEPDAGSDLAGLTTRAVRDGDTWRVTGAKVWSSRAHYADWGLLLARTDPTSPKHAGITAFALRMSAPGVEVRPLRQMNGDTHFNQVFLTDSPVPDGDRIGAEGEGWRVAITTLMHERGAIGVGGGGGSLVSRDQLVELARTRTASHDPVVRQRLAGVIAQLEIGRQTALRARARARSGRPPGPEGSGSKVRMGATLKAAAELAIDLLGPAGVATDGPDVDDWHTLFLTAPSISIRGGTDEIQRNILGERVLGLPREPRADEGGPAR